MNEVIIFGIAILLLTIVSVGVVIMLTKMANEENKAAFENGESLYFKDEVHHVFIENISIESGYKIQEIDGGLLFIVGFDKMIPLSDCRIVKKES